MFSDGPKKVGKFIKGKAKIASTVRVTEFSFEAISNAPIAYPDNRDGNLYLTRIQDPELINSTFKKPARFEDEFSEHHGKMLKPLNFTDDWLREKTRTKRRGTNAFDDEDDDLDEDGDEGGSGQAEEVDSEKESPVEELREVPRAHVSAHFPKSEMAESSVNGTVRDIQAVKGAPGNIAAGDLARIRNLEPTRQVIEPTGASHWEDEEEAATSHQHENFVPLRQMAPPPPSPPPPLSKEERAEAFEEAKNAGYIDGYKQGEAKGTVKALDDAHAMFERLGGVLEELEKLKVQVLESAQDILLEVCEAVAEAVLRREFKIHPEAFGSMLRQVIAQSVTDDHFVLRLDPQMFELLERAGLADLSQKIKVDSSIQERGDFRIESNLTAVDGNLRRMVAEMVERSNLDIVENLQGTG